MREAQRGSPAAFGEIYLRLAPYVHAIALARVAPSHAADVVQDTFVRAWTRLHTLREPRAFVGWLAAIARHRASDAREPVPLELPQDAPGPPPRHDVALDAGKVLAAVRRLPEAYREPLLLRLVEGRTGPEIARVTGLTHGSVRVNLHRGMQLLRAELGIPE